MAAKKNDPEKAQQMIKILDDSDYYELMKNRKSLRDMSIEERQIVAKYWVKYALEIRALPYERKSLDMFCMPCEEEEIKKIKEYNKENFRNYYVRSLKRDSYAKLGN